MRKWPRWLVPLLLSFVPLVGCSSSTGEEEASSDVAEGQVRLSPEALARGDIATVDVNRRRFPRLLEVPGRLELNEDRTARVGSPTEGRVVRLSARLGQRLTRGAPVVAIHSHELIEARSEYSKAKAELAAAEQRYRFALAESERAGRLFDAKALSLRDKQASEASASAAEADVERFRSDLLQAERLMHHLGVRDNVGGFEGAEDDGSDGGDVWVRAPLGGTVLERNVTVGAVVNPSDTVALISDLSTLWAVAEIPEKQAVHVAEGMQVEVWVRAFDRGFPGTIFHVSNSLDPSLRTVSVRAEVANHSGELRAEMYATIRVDLGESEPVLAVPAEALQQMNGDSVVFVAVNDATFELRRVELGDAADDGWLAVRSGLNEGERVVTEGSFLVKSELLRSSFEEE